MPTCVHVGLQNRRFFKILGFQDGLKFSSISGSIFYRLWVRLGFQLGVILGAKTPRNPKNGWKKLRGELPKRGSEYDLSWSTVLASTLGGSRVDFWRVRARFSKILNDFFLVLLPTLGMFSGVRVMFSVVTLNPSSWLRFRRSWQILQPIWQEKLRTCRGQRREKNFTTIFMHPRIFSYSCQLVFWREHHWLGSFSCSGPRPRARSRE